MTKLLATILIFTALTGDVAMPPASPELKANETTTQEII